MNKSRTYRYPALIAGALLAAIATGSGAAEIGVPFYTLRVWGILPGAKTHPLADPSGTGSRLLGQANELDAANGSIQLSETVGDNQFYNQLPFPSRVVAGVARDGDIFWVQADTPNNYRVANEYIGSAAEVVVHQSYTKDSPDARLTYTYTKADVYAFLNPEFGPACPSGDPYCQNAAMFSTVWVHDQQGEQLGFRSDSAEVIRANSYPPYVGNTVNDWPWDVIYPMPPYSPGSNGMLIELPQAVTTEIDLSGITVGNEFTVTYQLYAYAYDRGSHLGIERGANASARDPLGGDTGVQFQIQGLTPTNRPFLFPVPVPPAAWLFGSAALAVLRSARRSRLTERHRMREEMNPAPIPSDSIVRWRSRQTPWNGSGRNMPCFLV